MDNKQPNDKIKQLIRSKRQKSLIGGEEALPLQEMESLCSYFTAPRRFRCNAAQFSSVGEEEDLLF